jgi:GNAT superfamily N-acetyltransferase
MELRIEPLTKKNWLALADLFDTTGPVGRCWCMWPRIGAAWRRRPAMANRSDFHAEVAHGRAQGLLAFDGELAVGWCQVTPRAELAHLDRIWPSPAPSGDRVWSISCFYVRKGHRRRGITHALIAAALEQARQHGATLIEARPLDAALSPSATSLGYVTSFAAAGFEPVDRSKPQSPLMWRRL